MIEHPMIGVVAVIIEGIGILLSEKRTAYILTFVALATIIIFFMT